MNLKSLFKQPQNTLEGTESEQNVKVNAKTGDFNCPGCGAPLLRTEVRVNYYSCPKCDYYFRIGGRRRLDFICDKGSFKEFDADMISHDPFTFPNYSEKLDAARQKSGEKEAVICGVGKINGYPCAVFSMDANFMMGSMGAAVGEKITKLFEYATENKLPVLGVTVSGGARMQEGMVSLVQMAKTAGAVKKHSDAGGLYIVLLTNPTTGGVTASFAMLGDIELAEPGALVGFAGPRVIEQTLRQKLPDGFQSAESTLKCGYIDAIVERPHQKNFITALLKMHNGGFCDAVN